MRALAIAAVAGSALFTGIATAGAADMAVKAPPMAAPAPAFDWTGFYVGANAGGGWSPNSSDPYNGLLWPGFIVFPPTAPIITAGATNARLTVDQVTARLNYRFGGPVVARY
jgi:outer membrane immunogenic protein